MQTKKVILAYSGGLDTSVILKWLINKGYEVHGIKRRSSLFNTDRIDHLYHDPHESGCDLTLHHGDLTDSSSLIRIVQQVKPDHEHVARLINHFQYRTYQYLLSRFIIPKK